MCWRWSGASTASLSSELECGSEIGPEPTTAPQPMSGCSGDKGSVEGRLAKDCCTRFANIRGSVLDACSQPISAVRCSQLSNSNAAAADVCHRWTCSKTGRISAPQASCSEWPLETPPPAFAATLKTYRTRSRSHFFSCTLAVHGLRHHEPACTVRKYRTAPRSRRNLCNGRLRLSGARLCCGTS